MQQQREVKNYDDEVEDGGGGLIGKNARNRLVECNARGDFAGESLLKERHRQSNYMPKEFARIGESQFLLPTREQERAHRFENSDQNKRAAHCQAEIKHPIGVFAAQNVVEENLIEDGRRQSRHDHAKVEHHHEHHRELRRASSFPRVTVAIFHHFPSVYL